MSLCVLKAFSLASAFVLMLLAGVLNVMCISYVMSRVVGALLSSNYPFKMTEGCELVSSLGLTVITNFWREADICSG